MRGRSLSSSWRRARISSSIISSSSGVGTCPSAVSSAISCTIASTIPTSLLRSASGLLCFPGDACRKFRAEFAKLLSGDSGGTSRRRARRDNSSGLAASSFSALEATAIFSANNNSSSSRTPRSRGILISSSSFASCSFISLLDATPWPMKMLPRLVTCTLLEGCCLCFCSAGFGPSRPKRSTSVSPSF